MISSRQAVLSRTSRTGVEPNRSWGSKATRIGQSLEDDLAQDPETGCFQGILARGSGIFEAEIGGGFKKNRAERDSRRPLERFRLGCSISTEAEPFPDVITRHRP